MAQITTAGSNEIRLRKRAGIPGMTKHHLKLDMTPMVDLGFLLISFFVITTELSKPTVMDLAMPKVGPPVDLAESAALTVFMKDDTVYYYKGKWEDALLQNRILSVQITGQHSLRQIIIDMKAELDNNKDVKRGRNELMLLIKPGRTTSFTTLIDLLDEATISMIKKYAVVPQTSEEVAWLEQ
jgi:biopolymer transport protein ExbD